jgi:predicted transcriptional regulator
MPKKKGFSPERYQKEILAILKNEPFMSTAEVCKTMNMGYETGLKYMEHLHEKQHIKLKKIGNRRFWFVG